MNAVKTMPDRGKSPGWRMLYPVALLAAIPAATALALIDSCTFPWCDELCLCDGMYMKALRGVDWSAVSACAYNPFYPILLYVWAKLFGAAHFVASALSVVIGYVACVVIDSIARRREWWSSVWADAAFVFLFWGGWLLSEAFTTARPDVLALLLGALFADALSREDGNARPRLRTFVFATLLFLAAPYPLPLMFFFGLFLLTTAGSSQARRTVMGRGFAAGGGFMLGIALASGYYVVQQDVMRLLGSYVYFNSITGYSSAPFWTRVVKGYSYDLTPFALLATALALGAFKRRSWPVALFIVAIPLLMTLGGRYERYYIWTFYVPCVLLAVHAVARRNGKAIVALAVAGMALFATRHAIAYVNAGPQRDFRDACRNFVDKHGSRFGRNVDVVVAENVEGRADFYYPLMRHGARVWFRGGNALNGRSDEEKFLEGLALMPCGEERRKDLMKFIARIQRFVPLLPEKGLVLFYAEEDVKNVRPLLEAKGCELRLLEKEAGFSLWSMERHLGEK